nr:EscU/YscU/HrcU family type III secretion system export apparatus switch protein [uncultured Dethiosulfovibrio sp.]
MNKPRSDRPMAAAVKYDKEAREAPHIVASGTGKVAERIVEIATQSNVPVVEDAALVSALLALEVGDEIPVELYEAVAKVLTFVYRLDSSRRP